MMIAALTSSVVMVFFTAEFCPVSPVDATQPFGEKSSLAPLVLFPPSGFHFYQVEIQLSFKLSPALNGKAGDLVFYCFVKTGHATLLGFGGCSQQSGDRSCQSVI